MRDARSREAVLPCLLDRLQNEPGSSDHSLRSSLSLANFRKTVLRDLGWLLNTASHESSGDFGEFEEVRTSVLNYGSPDLCGRTASSLNSRLVEQQIAESIVRYEPRILKDSLSVRLVPDVQKESPNLVGFEIRGLMWANPIPEEFLLQTRLDLETGRCEF